MQDETAVPTETEERIATLEQEVRDLHEICQTLSRRLRKLEERN